MKSSDLPHRLKRWREEHGLTYRDFADVINKHLPEDSKVGFATLRDWEQQGAAGPRPAVLEALKRAYPELRLDWLLFGKGRAREVEEALSSDEVVEQQTEGGTKEYRVSRWPTVQSFPPVARELFYHVTAELLHTARDLTELDEDQRETLLENQALTVQSLLMIPLHSWGFQSRHDLTEKEFEAYVVALCHALSLITEAPRQGTPSTNFPGSLMDEVNDLLKERFSFSLQDDEPDGEG